MEDRNLQLYRQFRDEIDHYCFPLLKEMAGDNYIEIKYEDKVVGFLIVVCGYVDGLYVEPEYRGKGLAKQAVLNYLNNGGYINTLHIVNNNDVAKKFWNSILNLEVLDSSPVDTLYRVVKNNGKEVLILNY